MYVNLNEMQNVYDSIKENPKMSEGSIPQNECITHGGIELAEKPEKKCSRADCKNKNCKNRV